MPPERLIVMGLDYQNLDADVRKFMLQELEISVADGLIYYSNYLSEKGKAEWLDLLRAACAEGSDLTLAQALSGGDHLLTRTLRKKPKGGFTEVAVPHTANETLAEGQFNRLYIRGVCRRALELGQKEVLVYRAAERAQERPESVALDGTQLDAAELLAKLRKALDFNSGFPEPNTGMCVKLMAIAALEPVS
jgi:hypothetical protein